MEFLIVAIGGALGALSRYLTVTTVAKIFGAGFPYGTLLVNTLGSFILVFFVMLTIEKLTIDPMWRLFFAVGFLGSFTTFSSFSYETIVLFQDGEYFKGITNVLLNNVFSLSAGLIGLISAKALI